MSRGYTFEHQLTSLRALLYREDYFEHPYRTSVFTDIRPLVILMESILKKQGISWELRRETRLNILSFILGFTVDTTYDLTPYQASTIYRFLVDSNTTQRLGITAEQFLADCQEHLEGSPLRRTGLSSKHTLSEHRKATLVSDMPKSST